LARDRAVLLVEDEPMVRSLAARTLRSRGYEVVEAEDGQAGLQALESRAGGVDIVVSDVVMPRMTGTELAQTIADRWPNVPVLLMTGYADDMSLLGQRGPEAPPLLSKPFTPSQLAREVQRALGD
jgi:two-component system cell cycle sensor histidine kinase/response regulator CckA